MKKVVLAITVLALCSLSFAGTLSAATDNNQQQTAAASQMKAEASGTLPYSPQGTDLCSFNFTSGANNTFMRYCVTENGNIVQIETPEHQQQLFGREGYGICDFNSNTEYDDYAGAGDTGNWNPAIVLSQSATQVKIARTTSDGIWTLTQTITQLAPTSSVKVTMTLKNNTLASREVQLSRFADIDVDGTIANTVDATINSPMIFNSVGRGGSFGLALQNVGTSPFTYLGFVQNTPAGLSPCTPFAHQALGPLVETDGSAVMTYVITIPKGTSKTVTVNYKGL